MCEVLGTRDFLNVVVEIERRHGGFLKDVIMCSRRAPVQRIHEVARVCFGSISVF